MKPDFSNREFSEKQLNHHQRFKAAVTYAKQAAKSQPIYDELASNSLKSAYNVATSDWFNPLEILMVAMDNWTRITGDRIRILVVDDDLVSAVRVKLADEQDAILSEGEVIPIDDLWWQYEITVPISGNTYYRSSASPLRLRSGQDCIRRSIYLRVY